MTSINFKQYSTQNSIVNQYDVVELVSALDKDEPFTYAQWLSNSSVLDKNDVLLRKSYDKYLKQWSEIKTRSMNQTSASVSELFSNFLKQLPTDITEDESRYINNIDYTDKYEIESAMRFFVQKIKSVTQEIAENRQYVSFQTTRNSVRGTHRGMSLLIKDYLVSLINDNDFVSDKVLTPAQKRTLIDTLNVSVSELYDTHTSGISNEKSDLNTIKNTVDQKIDYDPYIFIDEQQATLNLLNSYGTVLSNVTETALVTNTSDEISLNFTPGLDTVQELPQSEFVDYNKSTLNIESLKHVVPQLLSSRVDYLDTQVLSAVKTGELFDSRNNIDRLESKQYPMFDFFENTHVKREQHIGGFYKPNKLGLLKYYSFEFESQVLHEYLKQGELYVYPNLSDSGTNMTKLPVDYYENFSVIKNSTIESGRPGEIAYSISNVPRFNGYQSQEQTNVFSVEGISRKDDSFDFWTGDVDDIWANSDVFELETANIYNIKDRQDTMYANVGHMYRWKTDGHGNEFGVLKKIDPFPGLTLEDLKDPEPPVGCMILDGDLFKDGSTRQPVTYTTSVNETTTIGQSQFPNETFLFTRVNNGMFFSRVDCNFDEEVEQETVVVDLPKLRGNQVYCEWLDGYVVIYNGLYELTSTNNDQRFSPDPSVSKIWDGLAFDQVCVEIPRTSEFYKLENTFVYSAEDSQFVNTSVNDLDDFESLDIEQQQATPGDLVVRTADSGRIDSFNVVCDRLMIRYTQSAAEDIQNNLLDVDIIAGNVLVLKTENYYILDQIEYDYITNTIYSEETPIEISRNSDADNEYLLSDWFYNEHESYIVFAALKTVTDNITQDTRVEIHMHWLHTKDFTYTITAPNIEWYNEQEIVAQSMTDLSHPKLTYNTDLRKYYVTCTGYYSLVGGTNKTFAVLVSTLNSPASVRMTSTTIYTATKQAIDTIPGRTQAEREVVSSASLVMTETSHQTISGRKYYGVANYKNSVRNNLQLNISRLAPDKFINRVEVTFGDEPDGKPSYVATRKPVITYRNFENLVGNDTRDPRNYLINHTYTNTRNNTCTIRMYSLEHPTTPVTYRVIVYQQPADITSAFGRLDGVGDDVYRLSGGVQIEQMSVYVEPTGGENMFIMLKTTAPDYHIPVMLKLAEPVRQTITFQNKDKMTRMQQQVDDIRLRLAYNMQ